MREQSGQLTSETSAALTARIAAFDDKLLNVQTRIEEIGTKVASVAVDPRALLDHAVEVATNEVARSVAGLAGCALPDAPPASDMTALPGTVSQ